MELSSKQIDFIRKDLQNRGIFIDDLSETLLDHLCCTIENTAGSDFENAYQMALDSFGKTGIEDVQNQVILLITNKYLIMKKSMFVLGYIAVSLVTTGMLFKIQHWPSASILLTLGIVLLNFGFLPLYFYDRYKTSITTR